MGTEDENHPSEGVGSLTTQNEYEACSGQEDMATEEKQ